MMGMIFLVITFSEDFNDYVIASVDLALISEDRGYFQQWGLV